MDIVQFFHRLGIMEEDLGIFASIMLTLDNKSREGGLALENDTSNTIEHMVADWNLLIKMLNGKDELERIMNKHNAKERFAENRISIEANGNMPG